MERFIVFAWENYDSDSGYSQLLKDVDGNVRFFDTANAAREAAIAEMESDEGLYSDQFNYQVVNHATMCIVDHHYSL